MTLPDTSRLPDGLAWTESRPSRLMHPLRPVPQWWPWLPDWLRRFVSWSALDWFDSRYACCWVDVVGWKLNGGARDMSFEISAACHGDARRNGCCYCNKIQREKP